MTKWNTNFKIKEEWQRTKNGEMTIQELSKIIASKLSRINLNDESANDNRDELVEQFKDLANDPTATAADFNEVWSEFYDFADWNYIWVVIA